MSSATSWREKLSVLFEGSHVLRLSQPEFNCEVQTELHPSAPSDRIREEVVVAKPLTPVRKCSIGVLLPPPSRMKAADRMLSAAFFVGFWHHKPISKSSIGLREFGQNAASGREKITYKVSLSTNFVCRVSFVRICLEELPSVLEVTRSRRLLER